jgi:putative hydrolase of the HAD superfamily
MTPTLEFILFDLDETLYPREAGLLKEVGRRIQRWLCERLELSWEEAQVLRRDYFVRYGTTLNGLLAERNVDAHDYLVYVHDVPIERYLDSDLGLAEMLSHLPLRRAIYTNATAEYAQRVLDILGVRDCFERIISIEDVGLQNKIHREAYERALALLGVEGPRCVMVEDTVRNLRAAKALGMATILVTSDGVFEEAAASDAGVDFVINSVLEVEQVVGTLLSQHN